MTTRIHFNDNVFLIQSQLQSLKHGLYSEVDPQFFLDKLLDDFFFIDSTLIQLYKTLQNNSYLVQKKEYLRTLLHCKQEFLSLAHTLVSGSCNFSQHCKPYMNKIHNTIQNQEKEYEEIRSFFSNEQEEIDELGLSSTEYEMLLGNPLTADI